MKKAVKRLFGIRGVFCHRWLDGASWSVKAKSFLVH